MDVAFTLCSNNYLAQAKTLGDSFLEHHPNKKFVIGLVDRFESSFDYSFFSRFEIIKAEDVGIEQFDTLINKYNISELNTSVKPSYIHHIFKKYTAHKVVYIDPDVFVTSPFTEVFDLLDQYNIILTPHLLSPVDDEFAPTDYHTLRGGVFNLGFIALSNYMAIKSFLNWWHDRVLKYGYSDFTKNMFYDQLWINYVPAMFDNYFILKHPGYNMAVWNLHERRLKEEPEGNFIVNDKYALRFYHFSSYKYNQPEKLSLTEPARYNFNSRPDLCKLFKVYQSLLIKNKIEILSRIRVYYRDKKMNDIINHKPGYIERIMNRLKLTTKVFLKGSLH